MLESVLRKMVSVAAVFIGLGYVLPSIATIIMLNYSFSQYPIESVGNIYWFSGIMIFIIASILLMAVGVFIVFGGLQYFVGIVSQKIMFVGIMLSSFYLLCLGTGSALILQEVSLLTLLLVATAILVVASATVYMVPSFRLKFVACMLGIVSGISLTTVTLNSPILDLVLKLDVPFPGPFMSMAILEGLTIILVSITALVYSILGNGEKPATHVFLSMVALIYGIGVFVGSLVLSLNFLNLVWKAPWELALHGQPDWVLSTVIFWAASLGMLDIGGIILILSACVGFIVATKQFSQL
ncbi:MAG: hypothetical protein OEY81_08510 [Candidatus Bathyarchaeota archaeon]|nr:hypothetical protein [Candidatus Bathyarchaeota archaeon]